MGVKKVSIMELPTSSDIASMLLAMRDDKGNDPFIRYQDGECSKGYLRQLIAKCIYKVLIDKQATCMPAQLFFQGHLRHATRLMKVS